MVSKNAFKSFTNVGERTFCVNRCKVTYFCVIHSGNFLKLVVCFHWLWTAPLLLDVFYFLLNFWGICRGGEFGLFIAI
jgi:hypothetical protein